MKLSNKQWGVVGIIATSFAVGMLFLITASLLLTQDFYTQMQFAGPSTTGTPFIWKSEATPAVRQGALIVTPSANDIEIEASPTAGPTPPAQAQSTLSDPNIIFDAGFRPEPDGFSFRNYGSRFPEGNLSIAEVNELFGDAVCASGAGPSCLPVPAAQMWIDTMNDYMNDGHCAGFTVASRRFYEDQLDHSIFHTSAAVTFDINQNVPSMRQIAKDWVMQVAEEVWQARTVGSPREVVDTLLNLGQPVDLGIFGRTGGGHSLLAYGIEDKGNGIYRIRVYDNNWPGRDLFVEVDYQANTWRYSLGAANPEDDVSAWEGDAATKTMMFIPFPTYDQPVTCPFCEGVNGNAPQFNFITLSGEEALLQVSDQSGNRIGHYGDDFVNEIADARLIRLKDNMYNNREPYLALPPDLPFTVQVLARPGQEIANSTLRAGGAGFTFAVDGLDLAGGQVGIISVQPDKGIVVAANGPLNPVLQIALEQNGLSTFATVGDTSLDPNESLNLSLDPQSGELLISNLPDAGPSGQAGIPVDAPLDTSAEDNTVSLVLVVVGQNQEPLIYTNAAIPLPTGGSVALDVANWDGSDSLAIRLDRNGDGLYEEDWLAKNEPINTVIDPLSTGPEIINLLGNLGYYLNLFQAEALLNSLAEAGGQCSAANTLTTHKLDGDDLGEVLYALNRLNLPPTALAGFLNRLDLEPDELAHIIFDLNLTPAEQPALLDILALPPAQAEALQDELNNLSTVDAAIDEWEWQNRPLNQLPQFFREQALDVSQMGYFLDELDLELVELNDILAAMNLSNNELAAIFYELNLTQPQWNQVLAALGREPQFITDLVAGGPRASSFTPVSSWQAAAGNASFCGFTTQPTPALLPSPTPTPVPDDDDDDGGDEGEGEGEGGSPNSPPIAVADNPTIQEDTPTTLNVLANDVDPDGDPLTIVSAGPAGSGGVGITSSGSQISIAAGTNLIYTPTLNFVGTDSFSYTISDGRGGTGTGTITVTVTNVNDPPTANNDTTTITEDSGANAVNVLLNDTIVPDTGETLIISSVTQGTNGSVAITGGGTGLTYTPNLNFFGTDNFAYTIDDGNGGIATATTALTVTNVNDPPGFTSTPVTTATRNVTYNYSIITSDPDPGDVLTVTASTKPVWLTLTTTGNGTADLTGTPGNNDLGNHNVVLQVQDAGGLTASQAFSINVSFELIVDTTSDADLQTCTPAADDCSLRGAINVANAITGTDTIKFDIPLPAAPPHTISVGSALALPTITDPVIIDGTTQPGASCTAWPPTLLIEIDGSAAGAFANGLYITAGDSTVRGLVINQFDSNGILLRFSGNNTVECNFLGTNIAGDSALANDDGITILAADNTIGGTTPAARNLISGNTASGISILDVGSTNNTVQGNYIGTQADGENPLSNGGGGILITSGSNIIGGTTAGARNLISGNTGVGVTINGPPPIVVGNQVQGNYIGTDKDGETSIANTGGGVLIEMDATNNTVGGTAAGAGNLISGNGGNGIEIDGAATNGNTVQGNYIGTDVNGTADRGNTGSGVRISNATNNTIGGTIAGVRNLISGNDLYGVEVTGITAIINSIQGNYIGTDVSGTIDLGNTSSGVRVTSDAGNNIVGGTTGTTPGGACTGACNLISGNDFNGIAISQMATNNQVQGNFIGTDVNGTADLGNTSRGITIQTGAFSNTIGGATATERNLISGNGSNGLDIQDAGTTLNVVQGNYLGTDTSGILDIGNSRNGVLIDNSISNTIGGTAAGEGNRIAYNSQDGILVNINTSINNRIRGNAIFTNTQQGIDLAPGGVTANDATDADTGPNNLQNFPVITTTLSGSGSITITGSLTSTVGTTFELDFFSNTVCDASGNGEGEKYIGSSSVTTGGGGVGPFSVSFPVAVPSGQFITATATDPNGNTSEFSACRIVP